ncbi:transposase domain-containing protein, partial [Pseudonocardia sp. TMWB2A]|uniref:transposase domain-containing protein n=1 Tax=Pseudonocardia sp. TMWB2A TaxID=687430 RepID=UPI00307E0B6D
ALTKSTLPEEIQDVVDRRNNRVEAAWEHYRRCPQNIRETGDYRASVLRDLRAVRQTGVAIIPSREIVAEAECEKGNALSVATIARWEKEVVGQHAAHWPALLVPKYLGRTAKADIEPMAWEIFKADYLRLEKPTASACYFRLKRIAAEKGWTIPSLKTFERRLSTLPRNVVVYKRDGEKALMQMVPSIRRDRSDMHAMEVVNADGHKFDVFVKWPDGTVERPILLGIQDFMSAKILAYRVASSESAHLVQLAFRDMVERYGIPRRVLLDNGRAFAAKVNTGGTPNRFRYTVSEDEVQGLIVRMGCEVSWATPYHGQAKPIERAWRDLCETVAKSPAFAGAYTGNKPDAKPENYASHAVPLDEFIEVLNREVALHNARPGRRSTVANGRSFDEVFAESYAKSPITKATNAQLADLLLSARLRKLDSKTGMLSLEGNRYW